MLELVLVHWPLSYIESIELSLYSCLMFRCVLRRRGRLDPEVPASAALILQVNKLLLYYIFYSISYSTSSIDNIY